MDAFRMLCKSYTGNIYGEFAWKLRNGDYSALRYYNTALIKALSFWGKYKTIAWENDYQLLYRGLKADASSQYKKH